jgi:hypothetical protein
VGHLGTFTATTRLRRRHSICLALSSRLVDSSIPMI